MAGGLWLTALTIDSKKEDWSGVSPCRGETRAPLPEEQHAQEDSVESGVTGTFGLCDPGRINAVDRTLVVPKWNKAARLSDLLLLSFLIAPFGYAGGTAFELEEGGGQRFADDSVVALQTLGATVLATTVTKLIIRRPRPLTYDAEFTLDERFEGDARLSFPSGHTSVAFAGASFLAVLIDDRVQSNGPRIGGIAGAYAAATLVAYLRMAARRHFFTDVVAGAALGTTLGWLIPQAHRASGRGADAETPTVSSPLMLGWTGVF